MPKIGMEQHVHIFFIHWYYVSVNFAYGFVWFNHHDLPHMFQNIKTFKNVVPLNAQYPFKSNYLGI